MRFSRHARTHARYPTQLVEAAKALLAAEPPDADADGRLDLTHLKVFTIDDASTIEVDDGLSVEELPGGGGKRVWVHVADPTRWLQPGGPLDTEARRRSRTLYLAWGMLPMFPDILSTGPFSLREKQRCPALSVGVDVRSDGSLGDDVHLAATWVVVTHKLTYSQVDALLEQVRQLTGLRCVCATELSIDFLRCLSGTDLLLREVALCRT